jgi:hypothetical protein
MIFNIFKKNNQQKGKTAEELLKELDAQLVDTIRTVDEEPNNYTSKSNKTSKSKKEEIVINEHESMPEIIENDTKIKKKGNAKIKEKIADTEIQKHDAAYELKKAEIEAQKEIKIAELDQQSKVYEKIPGYGYLFGIKDEFLPESTTLRPDQSWSLALGYMKEDMLNPDRTESLWHLFACRLMRFQNSIEGKSREQVLMARQQEADKSAASMASTTLFGNNKL